MNDETHSRPKIHRLPQNMVEEGELYVSRAVVIICLALLLVAIIPALWSFYNVQKNKIAHDVAKAQDTLMPSISNQNGAKKDGIVVRDDTRQMIGQLTRMPTDNNSSSHINSTIETTTSANNKQDDHKELLDIIGKY